MEKKNGSLFRKYKNNKITLLALMHEDTLALLKATHDKKQWNGFLLVGLWSHCSVSVSISFFSPKLIKNGLR